MTGVDAVTLEVLRNGFEAAAEEMNASLVRTGYSPNIKERRDCSTAVFDADGAMVSQAETMPVHLGAMPFSVTAALDAFPPGDLADGDAILLNDPFRGGAHLPDLTLVSPVFREGDIVAYVANRAHHADIGGAHAGSVAADSTEIYQEGLRIPPVKLVREGEIEGDLLGMILANVRTPDERRGDLRAQVAANETGRQRVSALFDRYGEETVTAALAEIQRYSERRMREAIERLPDGMARFEDVLDDDGRGNRNLPIVAKVTVEGDHLAVDFAETADQTEGPLNAVFAVTASATYYAVRAITDPDIPPNEGCYRPIDIDAPAGNLVNPEPPAAVVGGNLETSQRVTDVVLGALAEFDPTAVPAAGQGTMNNVTFGGRDPRDDTPYAFYETEGGGAGGTARGDGLDAVHVHMSNTLNTPVEVLETAYPLRVERYELRPDSAGGGEHRGGLGLRRDIRVREHDATLSLLAERHESRPYGLAGGQPGASGGAVLNPEDDPEELPAKITRTVGPTSVVSIRTPGGGGFGDPADRDPAAIRADLRAGTLSPERARNIYDIDPEQLLEDD